MWFNPMFQGIRIRTFDHYIFLSSFCLILIMLSLFEITTATIVEVIIIVYCIMYT